MIALSKNYYAAVLFFVASLFISSLNDTITKLIGAGLPSAEVTFFRFATSIILLLPLGAVYPKQLFTTKILPIHVLRGVLLFIAITLWIAGLQHSNIITATLISFTIPFFTLLLANIFLKEQIKFHKLFATIIGFLGIIIILDIHNINNFSARNFLLVLAAISFAALDIINKKYTHQEHILSTIFYSSLTTASFALLPAINNWVWPNTEQYAYLFALGIGANLILYFLLEAFRRAEASSLAPLRYLEILFSCSLAYIVFNDLPNLTTILSAIFIIPAALFVICIE